MSLVINNIWNISQAFSHLKLKVSDRPQYNESWLTMNKSASNGRLGNFNGNSFRCNCSSFLRIETKRKGQFAKYTYTGSKTWWTWYLMLKILSNQQTKFEKILKFTHDWGFLKKKVFQKCWPTGVPVRKAGRSGSKFTKRFKTKIPCGYFYIRQWQKHKGFLTVSFIKVIACSRRSDRGDSAGQTDVSRTPLSERPEQAIAYKGENTPVRF